VSTVRQFARVLTFILLGTVPIVVHAAAPSPTPEPATWAGLLIIGLAGLFSTLLGWRLTRQVSRLQADLGAERQRKAQFERHSRDMYRELERKLEERTAELLRERDVVVRTEKLSSLSRLVGGVAHELNNPLTAILGEATILRQRCQAPELSRGLQVIEQQASRCAGLIRDLAAFASLEQRREQPLDVHALLEGALSQAVMVAPARQVQVVRQYWHGPLVVTGNMEQLQQALVNVLSNAYQAMDRAVDRAMARSGDGRLTLRTRRKEAGTISVEVADTGVGIEPAVLPYIFDPFYSHREGRPGLTTGLGLSAALGLIQAHGGSISAESQVGEGTTIVIELPESRLETAPEGEPSLGASVAQ
jgi:two-component system NtrC family sensor kinase